MSIRIKVRGILSYPHLFSPREVVKGGPPKYSTGLLIAKTDTEMVSRVQNAFDEAIRDGFPSGAPRKMKSTLKDAAEEFPDRVDTLGGYYYISTYSLEQPPVVDQSLSPVIEPGQVYPGLMAWVALGVFTYKGPPPGVSAAVNGVMLTGEEGPLGRLDNKPSVEELFGELATEGTAPAPAPAPAQGACVAPVVAPPPAPAPSGPVMTEKAGGVPYEAFIAQGWTDEQLLAQGYIALPGGTPPAFV